MVRQLNRCISTFVLTAFIFTQVFTPFPGFAAQALSVSEVNAKSTLEITIPSQLGTVEELIQGTGPTLIHIQDAHGNYEAQKNAQAILHHLQDHYGIDLLLLEGAHTQKADTELIRFFPDQMPLTMNVAERLTHKALFTGVELFLLEAKNIKAYGIEDLKTYQDNGVSFREVIRQQQASASFVEDMHMQIERLTSPYLNKDLRAHLKRLEDFEAEHVDYGAWLHYLKDQAGDLLRTDLNNVDFQIEWPMLVRLFTLETLEKRMDMRAFETERSDFLKQLRGLTKQDKSRIEELLTSPLTRHHLADPDTGLLFERMVAALPQDFTESKYPNVRDFIGHLILQSELKTAMLVKEAEKLNDQITDRLAKTEQEKKVVAVLNDHRLLKQLFALGLTPDKYEALVARADQIAPKAMADRFLTLNGKNRVRNSEFKHLSEIQKLYEVSLDFYSTVKKRDEGMLENTAKKIEELNAKKAVVIAGGFHAEPFKDYFTNRNYNYVVISPKITSTKGHDTYLQSALLEAQTRALMRPVVRWSVKASLSKATVYASSMVSAMVEMAISKVQGPNVRAALNPSGSDARVQITGALLGGDFDITVPVNTSSRSEVRRGDRYEVLEVGVHELESGDGSVEVKEIKDAKGKHDANTVVVVDISGVTNRDTVPVVDVLDAIDSDLALYYYAIEGKTLDSFGEWVEINEDETFVGDLNHNFIKIYIGFNRSESRVGKRHPYYKGLANSKSTLEAIVGKPLQYSRADRDRAGVLIKQINAVTRIQPETLSMNQQNLPGRITTFLSNLAPVFRSEVRTVEVEDEDGTWARLQGLPNEIKTRLRQGNFQQVEIPSGAKIFWADRLAYKLDQNGRMSRVNPDREFSFNDFSKLVVEAGDMIQNGGDYVIRITPAYFIPDDVNKRHILRPTENVKTVNLKIEILVSQDMRSEVRIESTWTDVNTDGAYLDRDEWGTVYAPSNVDTRFSLWRLEDGNFGIMLRLRDRDGNQTHVLSVGGNEALARKVFEQSYSTNSNENLLPHGTYTNQGHILDTVKSRADQALSKSRSEVRSSFMLAWRDGSKTVLHIHGHPWKPSVTIRASSRKDLIHQLREFFGDTYQYIQTHKRSQVKLLSSGGYKTFYFKWDNPTSIVAALAREYSDGPANLHRGYRHLAGAEAKKVGIKGIKLTEGVERLAWRYFEHSEFDNKPAASRSLKKIKKRLIDDLKDIVESARQSNSKKQQKNKKAKKINHEFKEFVERQFQQLQEVVSGSSSVKSKLKEIKSTFKTIQSRRNRDILQIATLYNLSTSIESSRSEVRAVERASKEKGYFKVQVELTPEEQSAVISIFYREQTWEDNFQTLGQITKSTPYSASADWIAEQVLESIDHKSNEFVNQSFVKRREVGGIRSLVMEHVERVPFSVKYPLLNAFTDHIQRVFEENEAYQNFNFAHRFELAITFTDFANFNDQDMKAFRENGYILGNKEITNEKVESGRTIVQYVIPVTYDVDLEKLLAGIEEMIAETEKVDPSTLNLKEAFENLPRSEVRNDFKRGYFEKARALNEEYEWRQKVGAQKLGSSLSGLKEAMIKKYGSIIINEGNDFHGEGFTLRFSYSDFPGLDFDQASPPKNSVPKVLEMQFSKLSHERTIEVTLIERGYTPEGEVYEITHENKLFARWPETKEHYPFQRRLSETKVQSGQSVTELLDQWIHIRRESRSEVRKSLNEAFKPLIDYLNSVKDQLPRNATVDQQRGFGALHQQRIQELVDEILSNVEGRFGDLEGFQFPQDSNQLYQRNAAEVNDRFGIFAHAWNKGAATPHHSHGDALAFIIAVTPNMGEHSYSLPEIETGDLNERVVGLEYRGKHMAEQGKVEFFVGDRHAIHEVFNEDKDNYGIIIEIYFWQDQPLHELDRFLPTQEALGEQVEGQRYPYLVQTQETSLFPTPTKVETGEHILSVHELIANEELVVGDQTISYRQIRDTPLDAGKNEVFNNGNVIVRRLADPERGVSVYVETTVALNETVTVQPKSRSEVRVEEIPEGTNPEDLKKQIEELKGLRHKQVQAISEKFSANKKLLEVEGVPEVVGKSLENLSDPIAKSNYPAVVELVPKLKQQVQKLHQAKKFPEGFKTQEYFKNLEAIRVAAENINVFNEQARKVMSQLERLNLKLKAEAMSLKQLHTNLGQNRQKMLATIDPEKNPLMLVPSEIGDPIDLAVEFIKSPSDLFGESNLSKARTQIENAVNAIQAMQGKDGIPADFVKHPYVQGLIAVHKLLGQMIIIEGVLLSKQSAQIQSTPASEVAQTPQVTLPQVVQTLLPTLTKPVGTKLPYKNLKFIFERAAGESLKLSDNQIQSVLVQFGWQKEKKGDWKRTQDIRPGAQKQGSQAQGVEGLRAKLKTQKVGVQIPFSIFQKHAGGAPDAEIKQVLTEENFEEVPGSNGQWKKMRSEVRVITGQDIVAADKIDLTKISAIEGIQNVASLKGREKIEAIIAADPEVLMIRSATRVRESYNEKDTRENTVLYSELPRLKHVIRLGHGTDNVDGDAIPSKGSAPSVSALGLRMAAVALQNYLGIEAPETEDASLYELFLSIESFNAGVEEKVKKMDDTEARQARAASAQILKPISPQTLEEMKDRKVGVIGPGDIGMEFAKRAKQLGLDVYMNGRTLESSEKAQAALYTEHGLKFATKEQMYQEFDFVVVLTGLSDGTRGMIDANAIEMMANNPDFVGLINPDRGAIVDAEAALQLGSRYVIDEVPGTDEQEDTFLYAPHIGGSTPEAAANILESVNVILTRIIGSQEILAALERIKLPATRQLAQKLATVKRLLGKSQFAEAEQRLEALAKDARSSLGVPMVLIPMDAIKAVEAASEQLKQLNARSEIRDKKILKENIALKFVRKLIDDAYHWLDDDVDVSQEMGQIEQLLEEPTTDSLILASELALSMARSIGNLTGDWHIAGIGGNPTTYDVNNEEASLMRVAGEIFKQISERKLLIDPALLAIGHLRGVQFVADLYPYGSQKQRDFAAAHMKRLNIVRQALGTIDIKFRDTQGALKMLKELDEQYGSLTHTGPRGRLRNYMRKAIEVLEAAENWKSNLGELQELELQVDEVVGPFMTAFERLVYRADVKGGLTMLEEISRKLTEDESLQDDIIGDIQDLDRILDNFRRSVRAWYGGVIPPELKYVVQRSEVRLSQHDAPIVLALAVLENEVNPSQSLDPEIGAFVFAATELLEKDQISPDDLVQAMSNLSEASSKLNPSEAMQSEYDDADIQDPEAAASIDKVIGWLEDAQRKTNELTIVRKAKRQPIVAGHWGRRLKREGVTNQINSLIQNGLYFRNESETEGVQIVLFPASAYYQIVNDAIKAGEGRILEPGQLTLGARNIDAQDLEFDRSGVSMGGDQLKDFDRLEHVMIRNPSEPELRAPGEFAYRFVNKKFLATINAGLNPYLLVGETPAQRDDKRTLDKVANHILTALEGVTGPQAQGMTIVYKPLGLEKIDYDQVKQVIDVIRFLVAEKFGPEVAEQVRVLFGEGVHVKNAKEVLEKTGADGFFVGRESVDNSRLLNLVAIAAKHARSEVRNQLTDEQLAIVDQAVEAHGLTEVNRLYLIHMWKQDLFEDPDKQPLVAIGNRENPDTEAGENFLYSVQLTPEEREKLMGAYEWVQFNQDADYIEAAKQAHVRIHALDGGLGESLGRWDFLQTMIDRGLIVGRTVRDDKGRIQIGAKGTDLGYTVQTEDQGEIFVSIAEAKMLQLLHLANEGTYAGLSIRPLVNTDSAPSYDTLFASTFLWDRLDDSVAEKRTYRQVLEEAGVEIEEYFMQQPIPGVTKDVQGLAVTAKGLSQPGGHGQFGFTFFAFPEEWKAREDGKLSIIYFANGDNLNASNLDPAIIGRMIKENIGVGKLVTPTTRIDVKGGKEGVKVITKDDGSIVYVRQQQEIADAKAAGDESHQRFLEAGQPDGVARYGNDSVGNQLFNTNVIPILEDRMMPLLADLKAHVGAEEYFDIISPTRIEKGYKTAKDGQEYMPIDGAIGTVIHNINEFFMLTEDEAILEMLERHGFKKDENGRYAILSLFNVPRGPFFTPNKKPFDAYLQNNNSVLSLDLKTGILSPVHEGWTPPEANFEGIDEDDNYYTELQTIIKTLGENADISKLTGLDIQGRVAFPNATLVGEVEIINMTGEQIDFYEIYDLFDSPLDTVGPRLFDDDGKLTLDNVRIKISRSHKTEPLHIEITDLAPETRSKARERAILDFKIGENIELQPGMVLKPLGTNHDLLGGLSGMSIDFVIDYNGQSLPISGLTLDGLITVSLVGDQLTTEEVEGEPLLKITHMIADPLGASALPTPRIIIDADQAIINYIEDHRSEVRIAPVVDPTVPRIPTIQVGNETVAADALTFVVAERYTEDIVRLRLFAIGRAELAQFLSSNEVLGLSPIFIEANLGTNRLFSTAELQTGRRGDIALNPTAVYENRIAEQFRQFSADEVGGVVLTDHIEKLIESPRALRNLLSTFDQIAAATPGVDQGLLTFVMPSELGGREGIEKALNRKGVFEASERGQLETLLANSKSFLDVVVVDEANLDATVSELVQSGDRATVSAEFRNLESLVNMVLSDEALGQDVHAIGPLLKDILHSLAVARNNKSHSEAEILKLVEATLLKQVDVLQLQMMEQGGRRYLVIGAIAEFVQFLEAAEAISYSA